MGDQDENPSMINDTLGKHGEHCLQTKILTLSDLYRTQHPGYVRSSQCRSNTISSTFTDTSF